MSERPKIAIVGGGLAGAAAAVALAERGLNVTLLEARRALGGRASSFYDQTTGQEVDFCQHVSLGCCTNLADFCRRTDLAEKFDRFQVLHFFGPKGEYSMLRATPWLPAPLHLVPALFGMKHLTVWERVAVARGLWKLARLPASDPLCESKTFAAWLTDQGQPAGAIRGFWEVILVSALGEKLGRVSLAAARKVLVDGFMAHRAGYEMLVPTVALSELFGKELKEALLKLNVEVRLGGGVRKIHQQTDATWRVAMTSGFSSFFDAVVLAVPWRMVKPLLAEPLLEPLMKLELAKGLEASPITGIHLWFDKPITSLPYAVLVGKLSQWLFAPRGDCLAKNREMVAALFNQPPPKLHYYQVVISASGDLAGLKRDEIIAKVLSELDMLFPAAGTARLIQARVVTEHFAVFSPLPGVLAHRPPQETGVRNLYLAGDWTATGWPATLEGAVRSGYLAAEAILNDQGKPSRILQPDLPRGMLARRIIA